MDHVTLQTGAMAAENSATTEIQLNNEINHISQYDCYQTFEQ